MKKSILIFVITLLCVIMVGCGNKKQTQTPVLYKISFDSNGGSKVLDIVAESGIEIAKPTDPTKEGYKFVGWYLEEKEYKFNLMPEKNITLVAKWEEVVIPVTKYTITLDVNGGNVLSSNTITGEKGSAISLPNPTKEGYNFLGWYKGEVKFEETSMPEKNITLVAKWEEVVIPVTKYTITLDVNGGNALSTNTITGEAGTSISLPNPTKDGYKFLGWYKGDVKFEETTMPEENITLVAKWEEVMVEKTLVGKKVSILGDSISTFYVEGSIMNSYYSGENQFYYPIYSTTIKTVDLTWWYQLLNNTDMILGINNSWSGSCAAGSNSSAGIHDGRINTLDNNGTPDIVVIYLGTNDCASGFSKEVFVNAIETIVAKIKALGVSDIFITTLGYSAYTGMNYSDTTRVTYNEEIRRIASEKGCGIVPLDDYIQKDSYMFYLGDYLHYNAKGATLLSKIYEKSIKEYFGIEFNEEIEVERKELLPEGVLGKITATANSGFWEGDNYAKNVYLANTTFDNPQFSLRIEITKNDLNNKYYVTKIKKSGDTTPYASTTDFVIVISDSHVNLNELTEGLKDVVIGSIVEFDDFLTFPVEITFKENDGNGPNTENPYVPLEGQLHVGAYNEGVWTLYQTTVMAYSQTKIDEDSSKFTNFYIIKITKNSNDDNYKITGLKNIDVEIDRSNCDYYILIFRDLEAKLFYEKARIGGTVVITDDITSGNCSIEFK